VIIFCFIFVLFVFFFLFCFFQFVFHFVRLTFSLSLSHISGTNLVWACVCVVGMYVCLCKCVFGIQFSLVSGLLQDMLLLWLLLLLLCFLYFVYCYLFAFYFEFRRFFQLLHHQLSVRSSNPNLFSFSMITSNPKPVLAPVFFIGIGMTCGQTTFGFVAVQYG
jgi:hypothetical protein